MKHLLMLSCWALSFLHPTPAAVTVGTQSAFPASLLYIYATDSIYWPDLTGKLLRDRDTLLILPAVVYKVWCEALPGGRPKIYSNIPGVIAHQPIPQKTIAHVELQRTLFNTLNGRDSGLVPAKLWCDYTNGTNQLRTEVHLRSFSVANTTCDYSTVNGLITEGSLVNFTCKSWSGYPRAEHSCDIVSDQGAVRLPAQVISVTKLAESQVVTKFSMVASRENQRASIECSTSQQMEYGGSGRSFKESRAQKVRPLGESFFTFVSESAKHCEMILAGDYGITVRCQSKGGVPETDHSCWISGPNASEALSLMAKIQDTTYATEAVFNNTWAYQNATVTCALQQQTYYSKNYSFHIPGFKQSAKSCQFSQLQEGLQANCLSGFGLPSTKHLCAIYLENSTTVLSPKETTVQNGTQLSRYLVPKDSLYRGSRIVCTINQNEFPLATYVHSVPRFTESRKVCRFTNSSWVVRAVCEFSSGYPATYSECQLLVSNSSVNLSLKPDQERADVARQSFSKSYTVKLPGPDVSYASGSLVCRVFQGSLFAQTFAFRIAEYRRPPMATPPRQLLVERRAEVGERPTAVPGPVATEEPELRMSNQTVITLSLALLVALVLLLLMSLPIQALRRHLRRSRKNAGLSSEGQALTDSVPSVAPAVRRVRLASAAGRSEAPSFAMQAILSDVCNNRGYRANRRDGMPDIDQYSMFEFGHQPDTSSKRKSVLTDALFRCQMDHNRREFRFSM